MRALTVVCVICSFQKASSSPDHHHPPSRPNSHCTEQPLPLALPLLPLPAALVVALLLAAAALLSSHVHHWRPPAATWALTCRAMSYGAGWGGGMSVCMCMWERVWGGRPNPIQSNPIQQSNFYVRCRHAARSPRRCCGRSPCTTPRGTLFMAVCGGCCWLFPSYVCVG